MNQVHIIKETDCVSKDWYQTLISVLEDSDICSHFNIVYLGDGSDNERYVYYMKTEKDGVAILMKNERNSYKRTCAGTRESIKLAKNILEEIVKKSRIKV